MDGMVDGGILASIKHFPGHGDTDVDSHHDLPKLPFDKTRLDTLELYPFKELIKAGAPAVMVAHMNIPVLDDTPNMPSSISKKVVTDLLRNELGFKGLTVTDAMDMKGVKNSSRMVRPMFRQSLPDTISLRYPKIVNAPLTLF
ncbi:hypothetical protein KUH03_21105 [Sphingobacterium sp. E70]|uniref:glycoside hydrolase family 3 N-terminal domain-containing protein n=1 Tax=Sphingobacterium sp. E70 TaxID=2853439 RepID=UPI00211CEB2F|nr:glycoside hydrolase family 3 N-terminal domain-containing protein [Sphingobacterium sp. E70]ULT28746.1 hypothetical protein KUH03_21105 [Sphingobacterium sp. E70]